ncbi:MAG: glycosyltransferase family 4 protein [Thermoanaerobaculia bacterium]
MKRILFVTQTADVWGGMERWLHGFTLWLQQNTDWRVDVALARGRRFQRPAEFLAAHPHLYAHPVDVRVGTEYARVRELLRLIERLSPQIVVPLKSAAAFPAVAIAKSQGLDVRLVVPLRARDTPLIADIAAFRSTVDGVIANNRLFVRYLEGALPELAGRLRHVRQAAAPPAVPVRRDGIRGPLRLAYVGRLEQPAKRALDLIPFVKEMERRGLEYELHLFGTGSCERDLRSALAATTGRIVFHGQVAAEELAATAWPNLDVLLLFSSSEGSPNVVCEAKQHGVVPVIARFPGLAEEGLVLEGETGLTFEVGDVMSAAAQVERLGCDRAWLATLSDRAAADESRYTLADAHLRWWRILEELALLPPRVGGGTPRLPQPAGRVDAWIGPAAAHAIRRLLRLHYDHADAGGEWPAATFPVDPQVMRAIEISLDQMSGGEAGSARPLDRSSSELNR